MVCPSTSTTRFDSLTKTSTSGISATFVRLPAFVSSCMEGTSLVLRLPFVVSSLGVLGATSSAFSSFMSWLILVCRSRSVCFAGLAVG